MGLALRGEWPRKLEQVVASGLFKGVTEVTSQ